jgi:hypothetical protein
VSTVGRVVFASSLLLMFLPATASAEDPWEFRITPYFWFAGIKGDVSTISGAPVAPVEVSAGDALRDTQAAYMGIFEMKQGKHGGFIDYVYTDVESDTTVVLDPINLTLKSISKSTIASAGYSYEFYNSDRASAGAFLGARYWKVDTYLEFGGGLGLLAGRNIRNTESWVDPMIGINGTSAIGGSNFFVTGILAAGGFGVGSDHFYDASLHVGYQWSKLFGTTLGYRLFDVKYEDGSFLYDVRQQGWLLGISFAF